MRGLCAGFVSWDKWVSRVFCGHLRIGKGHSRDFLPLFCINIYLLNFSVYIKETSESDSLTHF